MSIYWVFFLTVPPNFQSDILSHEILNVQKVLVSWKPFFLLALGTVKKTPCIFSRSCRDVVEIKKKGVAGFFYIKNKNHPDAVDGKKDEEKVWPHCGTLWPRWRRGSKNFPQTLVIASGSTASENISQHFAHYWNILKSQSKHCLRDESKRKQELRGTRRWTKVHCFKKTTHGGCFSNLNKSSCIVCCVFHICETHICIFVMTLSLQVGHSAFFEVIWDVFTNLKPPPDVLVPTL